VATETEHPNWASNTTLDEGSDIYVCNRGNSSIARIRQDGTLVALRRLRVHGRSLGGARLNGIGMAPDHSRFWVTYVGRLPGFADRKGGVLEIPVF
jgi:hypothetical protein